MRSHEVQMCVNISDTFEAGEWEGGSISVKPRILSEIISERSTVRVALSVCKLCEYLHCSWQLAHSVTFLINFTMLFKHRGRVALNGGQHFGSFRALCLCEDLVPSLALGLSRVLYPSLSKNRLGLKFVRKKIYSSLGLDFYVGRRFKLEISSTIRNQFIKLFTQEINIAISCKYFN